MEALQMDIFNYNKAEQKKVEVVKSAREENIKILKRYKLDCKSRGLTKRSINAICDNDLRLFIDYIDNKHISEVTHEDVQDFLLYCDEERENGDEAIARKFTSVSRFYDILIKKEVVNIKNPVSKLDKPKVRKKQRGFLEFEEYEQILNYLDNSKDNNRIRNAALISFFYASGCRLTEVYQQDRANIDFKNLRFKVLGKGDKERICIFNKDAAERLKIYLDTRQDDDPALFLSRQNNRLSTTSIQDVVKTISKRAGITKNVHPHIFRHTRAMHLLKKGAKLETIQRVLGHSNISTTQIYAHMNMDEVQDEILKLDGDI